MISSQSRCNKHEGVTRISQLSVKITYVSRGYLWNIYINGIEVFKCCFFYNLELKIDETFISGTELPVIWKTRTAACRQNQIKCCNDVKLHSADNLSIECSRRSVSVVGVWSGRTCWETVQNTTARRRNKLRPRGLHLDAGEPLSNRLLVGVLF